MNLFFLKLFTGIIFFFISYDLSAQNNNLLNKSQSSNSNPKALADQYGYLEINIPSINSDHFYVVIDDDYDHYKKVSLYDKLPIPAGLRKITIISKDYDDYSFKIKINASETSTQVITLVITNSLYHKYFYSSYSWIETGKNMIIYTDDDSDILIDGELQGRSKITTDLPLGEHEITTKNERAGSKTSIINIKSKKLIKLELYNKPDKKRTHWLSLFPGASQVYKDETIKGLLFIGLTVFSATKALAYENSFTRKNNLYRLSKNRYKLTTTESVALSSAIEIKKYYNAAKKDAGLRDIFIYSILGIYVINIIDAFIISPSGGYRTKQKTDFLKDLNLTIKQNTIGMEYAINF